MKQICKNCKHFNPDTSVCDWSNFIRLENDWCEGFFYSREKENKMTASDFKKEFSTFTADELNDIIAEARSEIYRRDRERREELKRAFFKAWKALEDDGAYIYVDGGVLYTDQVEIE